MLLTGDVSRRVARAVLTTSISQIVVVGLSIGTSIAQARLLGAEGRGDLARFVNASALSVLFLGLGMSSAITYFVASGAARPGPLLRSLRGAFAASVFAVLTFLIVVASSPLAQLLPHELPRTWALALLSAFFALTQAGSWFAAILAARGEFGPINKSAIAAGGIAAVTSLVLLLLAPTWIGSWTFMVLLVIVEGIRTSQLAAAAVRGEHARSVMDTGSSGARNTVGFVALWRYSGLTWIADGMQFLTYRLDQWVVDASRGAAELGRYALAVSLAQMVWIVPIATARVLFPYSAMLTRPDAARLAWRAARTALLVSAALAVSGWIVSRLFVTAIFGQDFAAVPDLLGILLIGIVPYSVAKVLGNYLAGINAIGIVVAASGSVLALTVVLDLALIPVMGAVGAAWATTISYSTYTAVVIAIFVRSTLLPVRTLFSGSDNSRESAEPAEELL